jgi:hypothetical protein
MSAPERIGRYRILGELGRGAMGTVYLARDESLDREVALKVMSPGLGDDDTRARFLKEARAAAKLQHPNVVVIYELGEHEGAPYMALERLQGGDLQHAIETGLKPDPRIKINLILQVLAGLGRAHEHGIVHRDIKPSNIFLPLGNPAKIMDFGVARLAGHGQTTTAGVVVGTPNYMSPEQVRGGDLDGRSDLFSSGLILYELLTGEKAFKAETVVSVVFKILHEEPNLDLIPDGPGWERLRSVMTRALARDASERYPSARAMSDDLSEVLKDLGGSVDLTSSADQVFLVRPRAEPARGAEARPAPAATRPAPKAARSGAGSRSGKARGPARRPPPRTRSRTPLVLAGVLGVGALALLGFAGWLVLGQPAPAPTTPETLAPPTPAPTAAPSAATPSPDPTPTATPEAAPAPAPTPTPAPPDPPTAAPTPNPAAAVRSGLTVEERLLRADELLGQGTFHAALAEARAAQRDDPLNEEAQVIAEEAEAAIAIEECLKNARAALDAGETDRAIKLIKDGFAINPNEGRLMELWREATR